MYKPITSRDIQRTIFVESLHKSLRKQEAKLLKDYERFVKTAEVYLEDGLSESECVELLMIDGLSREAAEGYTNMALSKESSIDNRNSLDEYSFRFQDVHGDIWNSCEIGKVITASNEEDAWEKAERILSSDDDLEADRLISVNRVE